MKNTFNKDNQ